MRRDLTPKQAAFVRWYTTPGETLYNGTRSAEKAGYASKGNTAATVAYENLRKPHIQREIRKIMQSALDVSELTVDKVLADLEYARIGALRDSNWQAAIKASELHGKYLKLFADRVEHVHSVEEATEEELLELLRDVAGKVDGFDIASIFGASGAGTAEGGHAGDPEGAPPTH